VLKDDVHLSLCSVSCCEGLQGSEGIGQCKFNALHGDECHLCAVVAVPTGNESLVGIV
jgi:hypothetical protein